MNGLITFFISLLLVGRAGEAETQLHRDKRLHSIASFHKELTIAKARYPLFKVWFHVFSFLSFIGCIVQVVKYGPKCASYSPYAFSWSVAGGAILLINEQQLEELPTVFNLLSLFIMAIAYTSYTSTNNDKPTFGHVLYESISLFT